MKRTALLGFVCLLLATFSCKKDVVTPTNDMSGSISQKDLALVTQNGKQVNTDTIAPTTAIDVRTLGVKGDGYTDDTKALQNAINSKNILLLNGGTYVINQTVSMRAGVKIYGKNGATIKTGNAISGPIVTLGRYFVVNAANGCQFNNITFAPGPKAFSLTNWGTSVIYITNSASTSVSYCKFNFNQPYNHIGVEGVWVDGPKSLNTYIYKNICNTVGIQYAEAGACNTTALANTINNAHSQGMSAQGNGTSYCTGNRVLYNTINNAGCNGIVDWGLVDGTEIRGNVITGTGKSPSEGAMGEGIQAVAVNTVVVQNTISDAWDEYIEVGSTNKRIDSNKLYDTKGIAEGIVVNTTAAPQARAKMSSALIRYNTIVGTHDGIETIGSYTTAANIMYNNISNPTATAINIINNTPSYNIIMTGNTINMTKPSTQARNAILTYTNSKTYAQLVTLNSNTITYATTANKGAGGEGALALCTNNAILINNKVNGNNIVSTNGRTVCGINSNGSTYTGYTFTNNQFVNCLNYASGYQAVSKSGNNF